MLYNNPTYIEFLFYFSVHRNVENARKNILHEEILSGREKIVPKYQIKHYNRSETLNYVENND